MKDFLILRQTVSATNVKIGDNRHNATNVISDKLTKTLIIMTDKHHKVTNVIIDIRQTSFRCIAYDVCRSAILSIRGAFSQLEISDFLSFYWFFLII